MQISTKNKNTNCKQSVKLAYIVARLITNKLLKQNTAHILPFTSRVDQTNPSSVSTRKLALVQYYLCYIACIIVVHTCPGTLTYKRMHSILVEMTNPTSVQLGNHSDTYIYYIGFSLYGVHDFDLMTQLTSLLLNNSYSLYISYNCS